MDVLKNLCGIDFVEAMGVFLVDNDLDALVVNGLVQVVQQYFLVVSQEHLFDNYLLVLVFPSGLDLTESLARSAD